MMRFIKKNQLLTLFIVGLLIRFSLLFLDFSWDVNNHIAWAKDLTERGFRGFYETQSSEVYASFYPNYPPLSVFFFYLFYPLPALIYKVLWWVNVTIPLFPSQVIFLIGERAFLAGMLKLPGVIADIGIAWVCYLFAKKIFPHKRKTHLYTVACVLLNPAFFYNSAFLGQIDVIPLFFILWALYVLIFSPRYAMSGLLFTLSLLAKPTTVIFLPAYMILFLRRFPLITLVKTVIYGMMIFWVSFLPFLSDPFSFTAPFVIYYQKIIHAQSLSFVTNGAFNFWVLMVGFAGIKDTASFMFGLSYRIWGYILVGFLLFIVLSHAQKRRNAISAFIPAFFFSAVIPFLFLTKMHERYSLLTLPFLLLMSIVDGRYKKWFVIFSMMSFLNLYHSWPVPRFAPLVSTLSNPFMYTFLAWCNVGIFFYLYFSVFLRGHTEDKDKAGTD